jgi:hypothetical protein
MRHICLLAASLSIATSAYAAPIPPESPRWGLGGKAEVSQYQGRPAFLIQGGAALVKDLDLQDGVIDVDVVAPPERGFFGIQFRIDPDNNSGEWVYLRPHKSGLPDAQQYTPILNNSIVWQLYNGAGFTAPLVIPQGR